MDRRWMYSSDRCSTDYIEGVSGFLRAAVELETVFICCPCKDCKNDKQFKGTSMINMHLIRRGFMPGYTCWNKHGEEQENIVEGIDQEMVTQEEGCQLDDTDQYEVADAVASLSDDDDLDQMLRDGEGEYVDEKFQQMMKDNRTPLYPGCKAELTKLRTTLTLLHLKSQNGWSDKSFDELLPILKKTLPDNNVLPETTYQAKQIVCPLGLEVQRIHVCPNDCIMYRKEFAELDACPVCKTSRYKVIRDDPGEVEGERKAKRIPAKLVWYFPIIPRLKRLFANREHAKQMRWHAERKRDGLLRHPADGSQWRKISIKYKKHFASEVRNVWFGLSTDGMNPFGDMSSSHSTWPVTLCIYNLPPWLCMKRKYIMMPLLIQGPKQPGNDIDVFLRPLIDDLLTLWNDGERVWDEYKREHFMLRALLFVTINDWPALGNLSGMTNKGLRACIHCLTDTDGLYLKKSRKVAYMGHRRFLRKDHRMRKRTKDFDGKTEKRPRPLHRTGKQVFEMVKDLKVVFGKAFGGQKVPSCDGHAPMWKKRSIFFELPYWEDLDVRHSIDLMHITKNVCSNLLGFLNLYGPSKDTLQARQDLAWLKIRETQHPEERDGGKHYLPHASYNLSRAEIDGIIEFLDGVKVPSGYSSNIKRLVNSKGKKLVNMKSHDCHVLLTQLLPVAIRGALPDWVRGTLISLCSFFNTISQKVIDLEKLDKIEQDIIITLCNLEMIFPPSFFTIMVHLITHVVLEIRILGPVYLHNMFPFERYMAVLKKYVRNRSRPEGCIAEGYSTEEVVEFCTDYMNLNPIGVPISRHEGRLQGKGTIGRKSFICPEPDSLNQAHFTVLNQSAVVAPFLDQHLSILRQNNPYKSDAWLMKEQRNTFAHWLQRQMMSRTNGCQELKLLARGPSSQILSFQGYDINGYTFYTRARDARSTNQNSGVQIQAYDNTGRKDTYYGFIEEIWELDYGPLKVPLFRCKWVRLPKGVTIDKYNMVTVDLKNTGYKDDQFVLANAVTQVFYVRDMADKSRHVVLQGKRRIVGVENVDDEEEYNQFDDLPPFGGSTDAALIDDTVEAPYTRNDHQEGTLVTNSRK